VSEVVVGGRKHHLFKLGSLDAPVFTSIKVSESSLCIFKRIFDVTLEVFFVKVEEILGRNTSIDFLL
jgi:hypothetical protein